MHSNEDPAVVLDRVSKRFFVNPKRPWKLADVVLHPGLFARRVWSGEPFWALREVSLAIRRGEFLGIVGANGSGKSTLLRIMAGISPPTQGTARANGRVAALLEATAGFHPLATGRENAFINALLMGLSKGEITAKMPEIIRFARLEEFADQPVRTYSSGMAMRLGFSVAVHVRPEILLVDEVIAVGDADFREKCFRHFESLKRDGVTAVLVSHDIDSIMRFADRVLLLDQGRVVAVGDPRTVVEKYLARLAKESPAIRRALQSLFATEHEASEEIWSI